jgi:hypothetical protein
VCAWAHNEAPALFLPREFGLKTLFASLLLSPKNNVTAVPVLADPG